MWPLYVSSRMNDSEETKDREVELLLLEEDGKSHYVWVKDFSKICYHYNEHKCKKYPCRRCMKVCGSKKVLYEHLTKCAGIDEANQAIEMPKEGSI